MRSTLALWLGIGGCAWAQAPAETEAPKPVPKVSAVTAMRQMLRANRDTAPYAISVTTGTDGKIVLKGRVPTTAVYSMVIRGAIDLGVPFRDELVIDTGEAHRVMGMPLGSRDATADALTRGVYGPPPLYGSEWMWSAGWDPLPSGITPLWAFNPWNPPLLTYPPGWGATTARRDLDQAQQPVQPQPDVGDNAVRVDNFVTPRKIDVSIDLRGNIILQGTVGSEQEKLDFEQEVQKVPGVLGVVNLLKVDESLANETPGAGAAQQPAAPAPAAPVQVPPPPPDPNPPDEPARAEPQPIRTDDDMANVRLGRSLGRFPDLEGLEFQAKAKDGTVSLGGDLPSAYEAMLAYRAAQITQGVRTVVDRLRFPPPPINGPNPLLERGKPEDIGPYLAAQIQRQVGNNLKLDRAQVEGKRLQLVGTLASANVRERVEATLRTMPLLRGFEVESNFSEP